MAAGGGLAGDCARNIALYPWYRFCQSLLFWQAVWFLYFQDRLSAAEAILLYVAYDLATTLLEVPSGYLSDRLGRRLTLIAAAVCGLGGAGLIVLGDSFVVFVLAQGLIGASTALMSGTDSAFLYESLVAEGRAAETEAQEAAAWRFSFAGLGVSALVGGALWAVDPAAPFVATVAAAAAGMILALRFSEPPHAGVAASEGGRAAMIWTALRQPRLAWFFAHSVFLYVFNHVAFVFAQPFLLDAVGGAGAEGTAALVSGGVTALTMGISVAATMAGPWLRPALGLTGLLVGAFAVHVALALALGFAEGGIVVALLFLRMVPDAICRPVVMAEVQPMLGDEGRATYLSIRGLSGRLLLAASLFAASFVAPEGGVLDQAALQTVMASFAMAGLVALTSLALLARRAGVAR